MGKKFRFLFAAALFLFSLGFAQAEIKKFDFGNYSAEIFYLPENFPGDAVFVRLSLKTGSRKFIRKITGKNQDNSFKARGTLAFYSSDEKKKLTTSNFFVIKNNGGKKFHQIDLLSGIPLSSFLKPGNYSAEIEFNAFTEKNEKITFPIEIKKKDFVSETIHLNPSNTKIKTDSSQKRLEQIERLNKILGTTDENAVYDFSEYVPPTPATRRTSFFADRRIYAYSDGKSSTSLHYGIDFGVPSGNEVRSCAAGKVVMAEERISTGYSVAVEHLPGLYSLYYHNSELKVKEGDFVKKGDLIAISGATGLATGPHVHWEMRLAMEAVSPDFFMSDFAFNEEN